MLGLGQLCDEASPDWRWWAGASLSFQTHLCFSYPALQTATLPFLCVQVMLSPCLAATLLCSNLLSTLQELLSPPKLSRALVSASPCLISNYNSCACSKSRLLPQHLPASLFLSSCPSCMEWPLCQNPHRKPGGGAGHGDTIPAPLGQDGRQRQQQRLTGLPARSTQHSRNERSCLRNTRNPPR